MKKRRAYSIRERLFYSFFVTAALMCVIVLYSFVIINSVTFSITNAYESNLMLREYQNALKMVESGLENYITLRTFEGIENYYTWRGKLDALSLNFNREPSPEPMLLQEYKIGNLMESFLEYADKAVYARRGNNVTEYMYNYYTAQRIYSYLTDSIRELNTLYFERNVSGYNRILNNMHILELVSILLVATGITINFLIVYILINRITGPLVDLSDAANELASGNFDVEIAKIKTNDELGNIYRAFDRMIVSIREYIETIQTKAMIENNLRRQEMEMRELYKDAQLRTLQAQINPHFLFNTLNAGAQLAMMEGADNTCAFIENTADFFRYNIQNLEKDALLSGEINLVDNYMHIMKVRFADRLTYIRDIHCENLDIPMPSMILQPLVENAVKHGIAEMSSGGTVTLRVYRSADFLNIEISDNGKQFDPAVRQRLLSASGKTETEEPVSGTSVGIGMVNVITRLRMFFDDPDIFDIVDNYPEPGKTFVIRIKNV
ncbi:histidine kinase [Brucepastera parasyntrophica]|uniref:sensor histidine kinase n=1 Tax=Brucepastera parasyntrophica TaxID=2880008 RepID=UPI00210B6617|nr:histidine kinase [Brucepastera parasyntrophica]ULQ60861.1 histidine kinase [Brucepastera parasyntrophica]